MTSRCHGAKNYCSKQTRVLLRVVLYGGGQVCDYLLNKLRKTSNEINFYSHLRESFKIDEKAIEWCIASRPSVTITRKAIRAGSSDSLTRRKNRTNTEDGFAYLG